jgi:hypothetical protein
MQNNNRGTNRSRWVSLLIVAVLTLGPGTNHGDSMQTPEADKEIVQLREKLDKGVFFGFVLFEMSIELSNAETTSGTNEEVACEDNNQHAMNQVENSDEIEESEESVETVLIPHKEV